MKILKTTPFLVFCKIDNTNCLIAKHVLNFLADVDDEMEIAVAGYYNRRKQFIISKYAVIGKTKIMMEMDMIKNGTLTI